MKHLLWMACLGLALAGCNGSSASGSVTISPKQVADIEVGGTQVFKATGSSPNFGWSLSPSGAGSISSAGGQTTTYTAPSTISGTSLKVSLTVTLGGSQVTDTAVFNVVPASTGHGLPDAGPNAGALALSIFNPTSGDGGITPHVEVTGAGFDQTYSSSSTISVPAGVFDIIAGTAVMADPVVGVAYVGMVTGSPATVQPHGTTPVAVNYTQLGGSGYLWAPSSTTGQVYGYPGSQLQASGALNATITLNTDAGHTEAVAFDKAGGLWAVSNPGGMNNTLWGWHLFNDGGVSRPVVIALVDDGGVSIEPKSLAFGPSGDVWVADSALPSRLIRYTASQLATSGQPLPAQVITDSVNSAGFHSLAYPFGLAFDAAGSLWVGNSDSVNPTIAKFAPADGGGLGATPTTVLADDGGILHNINGLAFDPNGNLWVTSYPNGNVVRVAVSSLPASSYVAPAAVLTGVTNATSLAFDQSGNLWVLTSDFSTSSLVKINGPSSLSSGAAIFSQTFTGTPIVNVGKMQFNMPAAGTGLYP